MNKAADEVYAVLVSMWERARLHTSADFSAAQDMEMLLARAIDLARLEAKAAKTSDVKKRSGYASAAHDTLDHVRLLLTIRTEATTPSMMGVLERWFFHTILPLLAKILPVLFGLMAA